MACAHAKFTALVVAAGFSCREQVRQLAGVRPLHLAEVLARARPR